MNIKKPALVGLCAIVAMPVVTLAQETSSAVDASQGAALQEIVVTAEKRSEDIQTTPIAVTAITGQALQERGINNVSDLQYNVPGMSVSNTGIIPLINIRGIGLALVSPSTSSGIINYRDGVLITHEPFLVDPYYDQERIEVLRGPQGTLAGSNSTGGAVLVVSRNPTLDESYNGYLTQGFGDHDDFRTEGAISMPINANWAGRLAFNSENRNSYFTDVGAPGSPVISNNDAPGALSQQGVRFTLLGKPLDDLTLLFKTEYNNNRGHGIPNTPTPFSDYYDYASHVPFQLSYNETDTFSRNADWRSILTLDWQFSEKAELRSQTSWFKGINQETDDVDASAFAGQTQSFNVYFDTFQQEFDLLSTNSGPLQWTVGSFFYNDKTYNPVGGFVITDTATPTGPLIPYKIEPYGATKAMDYAAFGQVTYNISDEWQVFAGGRYTRNRRWSPDGSVQITVTPAGPTFDLFPSYVYNKGAPTGKVGVNWNVDSHDLIYAFVARGAKSGGFNGGSPTGYGPLFNPEYVTDYELGWKTSMLEDHLRMQLDGFYTKYKDFQLNDYNPLTQASNVANVGSATIWGPEAQLQAVFGGFGMDGTFAYVNSKLGEGVLYDTRYTPAIPFELDGHQLPYAPKVTGNFGVQYTFLAEGKLTPRLQYSYTAAQWAQVFQVPQGAYDPVRDRMGSRGLLDASLIWVPSKAWKLEAYTKNLTNKLYVQAINSSSTTDNAFYGNPRTYGVRATYAFGGSN